jgi:ribonuclease P protein component
MKTYVFPKHERLASKIVIDGIFKEGKSFFSHPIRAVYKIDHQEQEQGFIKAMFVVPKRNIKKAVSRNIVKRRMREAFRLNKSNLILLSKEVDCQLNIAIIFVFNKVVSYGVIKDSMVDLIYRFENLVQNQKDKTAVKHDKDI